MRQTTANGIKGHTDWNAIDWRACNRIVKNLRYRIYRATEKGDYKKVRSLQKLMLKCKSNAILSVRKVTQQNDGKNTSGVDNIVVKTSKERIDLVNELTQFTTWKAKPTRRVYIPKSNGKQRPLGIPVIMDRSIQAMVKNALEPEWEAKFESISYGFRPGRSCQDAITKIFGFANSKSRKEWVVDADIKGAFDNISHEFLLKALGNIPAKGLIKQWLKAGYMEENVFHRTETGTPQGGIISPLLANIALHGMEKVLGVKYKRSNGTIIGKRAVIRYADDFVVFCESKEDAHIVINILTNWLSERGLKLSEEKTKIVHITDGFNFLGFNVRKYKQKASCKGYKTLIKPSKESIQKLKEKLRKEWLSLRGHNVEEVIARLNPIIRGWANYFRTQVSSEIFTSLDSWMFHRQVRYVRHTHPCKSAKWTGDKYWGKLNKTRNDKWVFGDKATGVYLLKFRWFNIKRHILVKGNSSPDNPTLKKYWEQRNKKEVTNLQPKQQMKATKQEHLCPICRESLYNGEALRSYNIKHIINNEEENINVLLHETCYQQNRLRRCI